MIYKLPKWAKIGCEYTWEHKNGPWCGYKKKSRNIFARSDFSHLANMGELEKKLALHGNPHVDDGCLELAADVLNSIDSVVGQYNEVTKIVKPYGFLYKHPDSSGGGLHINMEVSEYFIDIDHFIKSNMFVGLMFLNPYNDVPDSFNSPIRNKCNGAYKEFRMFDMPNSEKEFRLFINAALHIATVPDGYFTRMKDVDCKKIPKMVHKFLDEIECETPKKYIKNLRGWAKVKYRGDEVNAHYFQKVKEALRYI